MVTIKDVAREVELSVTTVSRALNGYDDVAEDTRSRIEAAARALDYHPNVMARSLQNSRSNAVGLVIPPYFHHASDAFWLEFIGGVASACAHRGVDLILSATDGPGGAEERFRRLTRSRRVDGVLICDVLRSDPRIGYLQKHRLPFVAFGRTTDNQNYSFVDVDGGAGVIQAMEHLLSLGHQRIAYLDVDQSFGFAHFRLEGYRTALAQAGLPYDPELVKDGLNDRSALAAAEQIFALPDCPTAIFAAADFLALAVLKAARSAGLNVPGEISVAAFDDNPMVQQANPPLTAVSQPNRTLGEQAARVLLDRVNGPDQPSVQRLIVPTLVIRQSTGPPPHRDTAAVDADSGKIYAIAGRR
jgi:LacI family transcriptional regulator